MMLVELLVAMAVASIALVALAGLTSRTVADAGYFRHKTEATAHARAGVEWVKSQTYADIDAKKGSTYCINALGSWNTFPCSGFITNTIYSRSVALAAKSPATSPPRLVVVVTVTWQETRGKSYSAVLTTELTNN